MEHIYRRLSLWVKLMKNRGNLYHTGILIHNYQTTGTDDGIKFS